MEIYQTMTDVQIYAKLRKDGVAKTKLLIVVQKHVMMGEQSVKKNVMREGKTDVINIVMRLFLAGLVQKEAKHSLLTVKQFVEMGLLSIMKNNVMT